MSCYFINFLINSYNVYIVNFYLILKSNNLNSNYYLNYLLMINEKKNYEKKLIILK